MVVGVGRPPFFLGGGNIILFVNKVLNPIDLLDKGLNCPPESNENHIAEKKEVNTFPVSEIKCAPCTQCAHFRRRVHDFRRCAPVVCTFFELFIITTYYEGAWKDAPVHSFRKSVPCGCTK